ncbi:MAG: cell division protein ZipA C-terminal FtsZ-binding domain-containing protein [Betaproteobacteria bacterium]
MKDLQISLLVIGAVVVAAVWGFNLWQERQLRRRTEKAFAREHRDVLLEGSGGKSMERVEPSMNGDSQPAVVADPKSLVQQAVPQARPPAVASTIDPVIDFVVEVSLPEPAMGDELYDHLSGLLAAYGKGVMVAGFNEVGGEWLDASAGGSFMRLRYALQISDRSGCIPLDALVAFRDAVVTWADVHGGQYEHPETKGVHANAAQLDEFCADVDIAIGINVVAGEGAAISGLRVAELAEKCALMLDSKGRFFAAGGQGAVTYTLENHEPMPFVTNQLHELQTSGITFLLDVPRVADALTAFDAMLATARIFGAELNGLLVDDNRNALSDAALAAIRKQLEGILVKMQAGRIEAGGARALRLFG